MPEKLPHRLKREVRERQAYRCALCGDQHPPGSRGCISVHHVKARAHGGTNNPGNLVGLCRGEGSNDCHNLVDMLTFEHGVRFDQLMEPGIIYAVGLANSVAAQQTFRATPPGRHDLPSFAADD